MICPYCGKLGQDNHAFCLYCGAENPRRADGYGDSAAVVINSRSPLDAVCYETLDITGCEWREGEPPDPVPPERNETGSAPIGVHDVRGFTGVEWRAECGRVPPETAHTPFLSDSFPENGCSLVSGNGNGLTVLASPSTEGERSYAGADAPPMSEEERMRSVLSGDYVILRKLGSGGMASVYLARETALDREVAIKALPQAYQGDEQFSARFRREAQLSAMLEHPHIVRIYRIGEEQGLCYFVMNYIPGGALSDRMRNGRIIPIRDIVRWGADICSALAYAHEHGVIHRDLKPDNIMLDRLNRAVVADFGIAHALRGTSLTQTGAVIGTPQYMSPDQASGKTPDARSDIYSLGMMLYQMAAGTVPFRSSDPIALMYMHVHTAPQPPETHNPNIPPWLQEIILRCLAKKPSDRFPNAGELRRALIKGETGRSARVPMKPESERGIHSLIGAAANLVSSAMSSFRVKSSPPLPGARPNVGTGRGHPRHSLKLPRDMNPC